MKLSEKIQRNTGYSKASCRLRLAVEKKKSELTHYFDIELDGLKLKLGIAH